MKYSDVLSPYSDFHVHVRVYCPACGARYGEKYNAKSFNILIKIKREVVCSKCEEEAEITRIEFVVAGIILD